MSIGPAIQVMSPWYTIIAFKAMKGVLLNDFKLVAKREKQQHNFELNAPSQHNIKILTIIITIRIMYICECATLQYYKTHVYTDIFSVVNMFSVTCCFPAAMQECNWAASNPGCDPKNRSIPTLAAGCWWSWCWWCWWEWCWQHGSLDER